MKTRRRWLRAFTLVELLIAITILVSIVLLLTAMVSGVSRAWTSGEQRVAQFQDGRAVLDLMARELSQAVISPSLQFVQLTLPAAANQRAGSDSIFWQAPGSSTTSGNLAEIGYYLVQDGTKSGADVYQLRRFFVLPTDTSNYQIFTSPNQPTDTSAPWVTSFVNNSTTPPLVSTPVASGVLAFWVRCFDCNGDLIPWFSTSIKFNSAAHFQPSALGQSGSFKYTSASSTARANLLPASVELTIVTLDAPSFRRQLNIPDQAPYAQSTPDDLPAKTSGFDQALLNANIKDARTFSTRVNLVSSGQR